jgi:predicted  nucleic acid-binding Zn-ribbon protein
MTNRQLDNPNCSACDTKMNLTVLIPPVRESIYGLKVYTCPNCGRSEDYLVRLPSKAA